MVRLSVEEGEEGRGKGKGARGGEGGGGGGEEEGVEEQEEEQEEEEKEEEEEDCQLQTEFRSRPPRTEFWVIPGARNGSTKKYAIPTQMKGLHSKLI